MFRSATHTFLSLTGALLLATLSVGAAIGPAIGAAADRSGQTGI